MTPHRTTFAVICASNMNRSMEAHNVLQKKGVDVCSFGTGTAVRLPGPSIDRPNIYPFGTPYDDIYNDLMRKDFNLYTQNGLLHMLDRNRKIKRAPERFQECPARFDVVLTCEERVFDAVCEDLAEKGGPTNRPVHVINIEIKDNHEDALIGGRQILQLTQMLEESQDLEGEIDAIIEAFRERTSTNVLHSVSFY